jgi:DNA-binding CsgD family transcriptional regulator
MPLPSYLWLHPEAKLSKKEKEILKKWAENLHSNLK